MRSLPRPSATAAALGAVLLATALFRIVVGVGGHGMYWPDEIFQSLEPAHSIAAGEGLLPPEYQDGLRSWAFPGLLAAFLGVVWLVGFDDPSQYVVLVQLVFAGVAVGTAGAVYALARALDASRGAAVAGAAAFGLSAPAIYFGHRAMTETASALPVVAGLALVFWATRRPDLPWPRARTLLWAGASLLGLAVLLRLQAAVFCVALVAVLAAARDGRALKHVAGVLVAWAAILGVLDLLTWGRLFGSAREYVQFNLIEGGAREWGVEPFGYYAEHLWESAPELAVVVAPLALLGALRAPGLAVIVLAFFLAHATQDHKELRFVLPMLPPLCALAALGVDVLGARGRRIAVAVVVALALVSAFRADTLTWGKLGSPSGPPSAVAWERYADVNRLLLAAHDRDDLCGLQIEGLFRVWTGGYAYLHRDVPLYEAPRGAGHFNYVVRPIQAAGPGETVVRATGGVQLVRVRDTCVPDPGFVGEL